MAQAGDIPTPAGACDCHSHVYGPFDRFPLPEGAHAPAGGSFAAYVAMLDRLGVDRAVIVQPSAYRTDNACTLAAMAVLGPDRARGIAVVDPDMANAELRRLDGLGMRGARFHDTLAGLMAMGDLERFSARVAPLGWHVQVQGNGTRLPDWEAMLGRLPSDFVVDHVGLVPHGQGADHPAFRALLRLVEGGRCWVKLSAIYYGRDPDGGWRDMEARVKALVAARPDRMVWGVNWPHPSLPDDARPDDRELLQRFLAWLPDETTRHAVLAGNAARLYRF
ncbi:D-galactarolactone isomerase [Stella humosa]|uniref:D-galactarolactone isomerase n=1 Tax=Stella humosa TaxID=94 RepID=A0A3N1KM51_9PROT|nr:amidohydrolase family protein [Stella humosa]ROP81414.1 D-galactarolactone isomerase [Stella humosa]BBK32766.1 hydrolase [Stella humosa]